MAFFGLFKPKRAIDKAADKCFKADLALMTELLMFYESHKAVGTELTLTEDDLAFLDGLLINTVPKLDPADRETTCTGVAVFYGALVTMTLGGKWSRADKGEYAVEDIGKGRVSVNPFEIVRSVINSGGARTLRSEYSELKEKVG